MKVEKNMHKENLKAESHACVTTAGKQLAYDIVIIGGGPAGLAAAIAAREQGVNRILILERDKELGGILNQCIHNGFGLHTFKEELTGPEYAARYLSKVEELQIEYKLNTMVMDITSGNREDAISYNRKLKEKSGMDEGVSKGNYKVVLAMNRQDGMFEVHTDAVILAMGCRERPRGALNIPGYRPAGIFSAGTAQRLVNMEGYMPGREVVILGSGDIGLIMARRMTLEGAKVKVVAELMPYSGGLKRNIVQCLDDYGIPLKLGTTVVDIKGKERVEGVTLAKVDENGKPIPGTEEEIACDTLLLSVGLLPENELSRQCGVKMDAVTRGPQVDESLSTSIPGIFACGNVLHVHDLVDYVSEEAALAGRHAAEYVKRQMCREGCRAGQHSELYQDGQMFNEELVQDGHTFNEDKDGCIALIPKNGVRYTVPQYICPEQVSDDITVRFRVGNVYKNCYIGVYFDDERILHKKKQIMAPGEMESIVLTKKLLSEHPETCKVIIQIEEA